MQYSPAVLDHFENPRNVGSFPPDEPNVGTGLVGSSACGDLMQLQIKVENDRIVDVKFKTFGCVASNVPIATPRGYQEIKDLKPGDTVWAWDGYNIVENYIVEIYEREVHMSELVKVGFDGSVHFKFIASNDHIWWSVDQKPIESASLRVGDQLFQITERELRSRNNVGRQEWLKEICSKLMKETNKKIDHTSLPQKMKGFKHSLQSRQNMSLASQKKWASDAYRQRWEMGMQGANTKRPTSVEKKFIDLFSRENIDVRYVGDGSFWVGSAHLNPDFKVNGQKKVIEVYTRRLPAFMQDRSTDDWTEYRRGKFASAGFDSLFLAVEDIDNAMDNVNKFVHNGITVISHEKITDKRQLRGIERNGEWVKLYDLKLNPGANVYFVGRVASHNCGSAIASTSLATEWIKGKTLDEALLIKNVDIVKELSLPKIKVHCSVLAHESIVAAIDDFRKKEGNSL